MAQNSSRAPAARTTTPAGAKLKPAKPYADFPLFPHATGRWAKKIRGRFAFFGPWSDPQGALERFLDQRDALMAGLVPRGAGRRAPAPRTAGALAPTAARATLSPAAPALATPDAPGTAGANVRGPRASAEGELTVRELVNRFLTAKQRSMESGQMGRRAFSDYHAAAGRMVKFIGPDRIITDLDASDFGALRARLAKERGAVTLGNEIGRVRGVFKFAYDSALIDRPVRFGPEFGKPSKRAVRLARAARGSRMFEPPEIKAMLAQAGVQLKAMILLGVNAGFGNTDVSALQRTAVNLKTGMINFPRPKTGIARRVALWPETIAALKAVATVRPAPKRTEDADLVFITKYGHAWVRVEEPKGPTKSGRTAIVKDAVSLEFGKLARETGTHAMGRGFYALRHTFRTIADEVGDRRAIDLIMGHEDGQDISTHYVERIGDDRVRKVVEHVRAWAWGR